MAGLPDNRSLLSFLSLLNGGNKDSLGDSTYLDSFKPTEYFANLQGGSPAMQGIYNLGNTVANLANRENNEKTRRIQQNIMQNTAMFTNAFQQEIRNLDKDYAADIDASVAELYATTDPAKQELIRKDIIGKQAAYRKAISDKVNLFRGYATQGSPWLLPNKVESVLSGAPSVIEASLGVPQPSVKSIGDTQGKGATTPKWSESDIDMLLDRFGIYPLIQNTALDFVNSSDMWSKMLAFNNIRLDDGISEYEASVLKGLMDDNNNFNENNTFTRNLPSILIKDMLDKNPELKKIYDELNSNGLGDPFYKKLYGIASETINNVMKGGSPVLNNERNIWKTAYDVESKNVKDEHERQVRDADNKQTSIILKAFNNDPMLQNQRNLDIMKGNMEAGYEYLKGRTSIDKDTSLIRNISKNITPEGVTDSFDNTNVFSREVDDILGILNPRWKNKSSLRAAYGNHGSNSNLQLFYDLQLLDRFSSRLSDLGPQERKDALRHMGDVLNEIRQTSGYPDPRWWSKGLTAIGLPSTNIVDNELNQMLYIAGKGLTSNLIQGTREYAEGKDAIERLNKNHDTTVINRAAKTYIGNRQFTSTPLNAKERAEVANPTITQEDEDAQGEGIATITDRYDENPEILNSWVAKAEKSKQTNRRALAAMVNIYMGIARDDPIFTRADAIEKLEGKKDSIAQKDKVVYETLLKTLKDPKQYKAFTEVIQDILNSTK